MDDTLSRKSLALTFELSAGAKAYHNGGEIKSGDTQLHIEDPINIDVVAVKPTIIRSMIRCLWEPATGTRVN